MIAARKETGCGRFGSPEVLPGLRCSAGAWPCCRPSPSRPGGRASSPRLTFGIDQVFDVNDNLDLDVDSAGTTAQATTGLSFGLSSDTEISSLVFGASTDICSSGTGPTAATRPMSI